jgi:predicted NBD/HSP70 family sugar kinase
MRPTPARQASLREHNLGIVLGEVLDAAATGSAPPSRADVAAATGLARATVSALVDRLVAAGLVAELAPTMTQRAGRPAVPLRPAAGTLAAVGAEINVDYLGVRVLDLSGSVIAEAVHPGDFRGVAPEPVLKTLGALVDDVVDGVAPSDAHRMDVDDESPDPRIAGTGLALPGIVDRGAGPLRIAPNLGWRDVDVVKVLASTSRTFAAHPPVLANEADLAARAESYARRADAPDGRPSFVYVSGEIGIGSALVLDGTIFAGRHGWTGELGHTLVDGKELERLVGQDALLRAAGLDPRAGVESLVRGARAGDDRVRDVLREAGTLIGQALANVVNLVDVGHIVLGGTYARLADWIAEPVRQALERHVLAAPWATPEVSVARAGSVPALTGAALAVLAEVAADPSAWIPEPVAPDAGSTPTLAR